MESLIYDDRDAAIRMMRLALDECNTFQDKAILLFSGGRDSTIVASSYCAAVPNGELHLLFIDNGVLLDKDNPFEQFTKLRSMYPENRIIFHSMNADSLMNQVAIREIENDFLREHFQSLLVCVSCKLIMYYEAILYGLKTGISIIMDGDSIRQDGYPEQTSVFLEERNQLFDHFGFTCISPLYYFLEEKNQVKQILKAFSFEDKKEAKCMFSDSFSKATEDDLRRYITKSISLILQQESDIDETK